MSDEWPTPSALEQKVFFAALGTPDLAERAAYLDVACRGQPNLRQWVEAEIRRQTNGSLPADSAISVVGEEPRGDGDTSFGPDSDALLMALKPEEAGDRIGVYKLIEPLGEGGFGIVWMAYQEQPVRRQVALKIIRLGMNSKEVMARFSQERQALALMDHPGIAKVFDAGATPFGRPFFVMELVHGIPITDYCDEAQLTIRERLEMFMQVCYAVQHAHQKGIIHRDLKPPNVLITLQDGVPTPKVIDFGIAKATQQQRLTELTLVTQREFMLGTPLYMSPEQTGMSDLDIDTRSDIYSLGVLLYTLLTGQTPIDPEILNQASFDEMARIVRDKELPRPTTVLRALSRKNLAAVAGLRQITGPRFVLTILGDLEWICMKALEKDRRRRYASASAFASDIQRYLLNEPINARPPDRWYRLRKLISRNRRAFIVGTFLVITILAGAITGVTETLRARAAEQTAQTSQRTATQQRERAERAVKEARLSEYVADVAFAQQSIQDRNLGRAVQLLDKHRPEESPGPDLRGFAWRYLWGLSRGDPHRTFPGLNGPAAVVTFSPDGKLLAAGGSTQAVVYETRTQRPVFNLPSGAEAMAFLPDGATLVTISDRRIHLWRTQDWTEQASWFEGPGPLVLSRDGSRLAVVCADGVRVRDTTTWKETRYLPGAVSPIALSPDGSSLAGNTSAGITLWRLDNGKGRVLPNSAGLFSSGKMEFLRPIELLAFTPDGSTLIAPQNWLSDRGVFLLRTWDTRSGQETALMSNDPQRPQHTGAIASLTVSPDGATVATTGLDHTVCLWDLNRRLCIAKLDGHRAEVGGSTFSPDGRLLVTCDRLGAINAWPVQDRTSADVLLGTSRPLGCSADGRTLAALTNENTVVFYDPVTKQARASFALDPTRSREGQSVALSADLRLLAEGLDTGYVKVRDTGTGETRNLYVANGAVDLVALTPDGETLITGSHGKILRTHNFRTKEETYLPFSARRVVVSPDGGTLAAVSARYTRSEPRSVEFADDPLVQGSSAADSALKGLPASSSTPTQKATDLDLSEGVAVNGVPVWDLRNHVLRGKLEVEVRHVLDGAFSPDGRVFATAVSDNTIQLWNTETCKNIGTCTGHKQVVNAVAFAYDGKNLASASEDGTIRLWDTRTQQELLTILDLGDQIRELLFSPDKRLLIAACTPRAESDQLHFYRAPLFDETDKDFR